MMQIVRVPCWNPQDTLDRENPLYDFVRRFSLGKDEIVWSSKQLGIFTNDVVWINNVCESIAGLSRSDLCTLYLYTTSVFIIVNKFLLGESPRELDLIYDRSLEWTFGERDMLNAIRIGRCREYLSEDVDTFRFLTAAEDIKSEQDNELVFHLYAELQPFFTDRFLQVCRNRALQFHPGIALISEKSLEACERAIPTMDSDDWCVVLKKYVIDLQNIFFKIPPCRRTFIVWRGERSYVDKSNGIMFVSTSLSREDAVEFADPILKRIVVKAGTRVIPMFTVSRYNEQEVLMLSQTAPV